METQTNPRRGRRRLLLAALTLALAVGSASAAAFSLALFTAGSTVGGNAFSAGTVDLGATPATALLSAGDLLPGDSVNGDLAIANTGTAQLQYAMSSAVSGTDPANLLTVMTLTVKTLGTSCSAFDGTAILSGVPLASASFGSPTAGHPGYRVLDGGATEHLCFRATLPSSAGNALQGASASVQFTFAAEQTANNP